MKVSVPEPVEEAEGEVAAKVEEEASSKEGTKD